MRIQAGTGHSSAREAKEAGREAALKALAGLGGQSPALVIVYTAPRYDLPALLAGVRSVTGSALLIGATGSGEIVRGQYLGFGAGVAVLALTAGPYSFGVASASRIRGDLDRAGQELARQSRAKAGPGAHGAILLLADSLLGDLQQLIQGIYRVTGPKIPVIGGAAGDEQQFVATFVFHDDQVIEQGAAALWISSDHPLTVATRHGWKPLGVPLIVTRAEGAVISQIGGRPAADVFEEQLGLKPGQLTPDIFWGTSVHHPFGMLQPDGSSVIRMARSKTADRGLCIQGCGPPSGSAVQVMHSTTDMLLDIVEEVVAAVLHANSQAGVILVFSCAARAALFKERAPEEPRRLQEAAGSTPAFGIYCCGEFSRVVGVLGTHNTTLTAMAL